ncbi:uncharacterized protein LOC132611151 [Lycium barbarum]|uniref:uncharacterized protein LOC132611151 n=1 Tax=Lycium barbarum TaxID=112863 RepID=UPI00293EEDF4|nr:uncharacterized protein LOC132611151 [Lycium barbarum]
MSSQTGGIGGVFRDSQGQWIIGFQGNICSNSPLHSELQALQQGLVVALNRQLVPLEIETECPDLIKAINVGNTSHNTLVNNCRRLMLQEKMLFLKHNFRQANGVAHVLTKEVLKKSKPFSVYRFVNPRVMFWIY